jgi:Zn ribbon nucleic-acid-binding protein
MKSIPALRNTVKLSTFDIENLPNHKIKSSKEWSSTCPTCGGKDRFLFWPNEGNFWCRQCELSGFIDQEAQSTLTDDQRADIERRKRHARQAELDRKRTALEKLQIKRPDIIYHKNLNGQTQYLQERWGLHPETIEQFRVGYCQACPTSTYSDSFTIPYYWAKRLINVRHRLLNPNGSGKYRPEASGLPTAIFNANMIKDEEWLVLVEGEFKAMVLYQYGFPTIAIPGASNDGLIKKCLPLFSTGQTVYVVLDPGADAQALKIGKILSEAGIKTRLVSCPTKPDDFFTLYGGTTEQFGRYMENGSSI